MVYIGGVNLKKNVIMALCLLLITSIAFGADRYQFIAHTNEADFYFDKNTIKYVQNNVLGNPCIEVWTKIQYYSMDSNKAAEEAKDYPGENRQNYTELFMNLDCVISCLNIANSKCQELERFCYDKQGRELAHLVFPANDLTHVSRISPDSIKEAIYNKVINYAKKNDELLKSRM
jgi:hypothetical protein